MLFVAGKYAALRPGPDKNVSVTSFALEALRASDALTPVAAEAAKRYLSQCQKLRSLDGDGGFCFTPRQDDPRNKAGSADPHDPNARAKSYETATLDGLSALALCGIPSSDPRALAAAKWLDGLRVPDDMPDEQASANVSTDRSALAGLRYYRFASLARCKRFTPVRLAAWEPGVSVVLLLAEQRPDGSWRNANSLMREDDPLIATSLALVALADNVLIEPPSQAVQSSPRCGQAKNSLQSIQLN